MPHLLRKSIYLLLLSPRLQAAPPSEIRVWTSTQGTEMEARYVTADLENITLFLPSANMTRKFPWDVFSENDVQHVKTKLHEKSFDHKPDLRGKGVYLSVKGNSYYNTTHLFLVFQEITLHNRMTDDLQIDLLELNFRDDNFRQAFNGKFPLIILPVGKRIAKGKHHTLSNVKITLPRNPLLPVERVFLNTYRTVTSVGGANLYEYHSGPALHSFFSDHPPLIIAEEKFFEEKDRWNLVSDCLFNGKEKPVPRWATMPEVNVSAPETLAPSILKNIQDVYSLVLPSDPKKGKLDVFIGSRTLLAPIAKEQYDLEIKKYWLCKNWTDEQNIITKSVIFIVEEDIRNSKVVLNRAIMQSLGISHTTDMWVRSTLTRRTYPTDFLSDFDRKLLMFVYRFTQPDERIQEIHEQFKHHWL